MNIYQYEQSAELQRDVASKLVRLAQISPHDSIVDIGCGTGFISDALINRNIDPSQITNVDANANALSFIKLKYPLSHTILADLHAQPFENKQFNVAISSMVLQWSPDTNSAIEECTRIAKKFFFAIPTEKSFARITEKCESLGITNPIMQMPNLSGNRFIKHIDTMHHNFICKPVQILKNMHLLGLKNNIKIPYSDLKKFAEIEKIEDRWCIDFFESM